MATSSFVILSSFDIRISSFSILCLFKARPTDNNPPVVKETKKRLVLIILSNRLHFHAKKHFIELTCNREGDIASQRRLPRAPTKARFDEVWENDEGRSDFDSCHSFKKKYTHKLIRKTQA